MTKQIFGADCIKRFTNEPFTVCAGRGVSLTQKKRARLCAAAGLGALLLGLAFAACDNGNNGTDNAPPPKTEEEKKQEQALDEFNTAKSEDELSKLLTEEKFSALELDSNVWKSYSELPKEQKAEIAKSLAAKEFKNKDELNKGIESAVLRVRITAKKTELNTCLTYLLGSWSAGTKNAWLEKMYGYFAYKGFKELADPQIDFFNEKIDEAKANANSGISVYGNLDSSKRTVEHTINAVLEVHAIYSAALKSKASYPAENPVNPKTITAGAWEDGEIAAGETKWYEFSAAEKKNYYIWWSDSKSGNSGKTCDIKVSAQFGEDGKVFFKNEDTGWGSYKKVTAESNGKVYIKVEAKEAAGSGTFGIVFNTNSTRPIPDGVFSIKGRNDEMWVGVFTVDVPSVGYADQYSADCAGYGNSSDGVVSWSEKPSAGTYTFVIGKIPTYRKFLNVTVNNDGNGSINWKDGVEIPIL
ncbi:MAG: hypothetical protein LBG72_03140 [Spirochaetaceae bacterium]|jgi:hypothetical protein|nr:hypothetical protein [Spirochaetaceae bacterium]